MQSRSEILIRRNGVMQMPPKPLPAIWRTRWTIYNSLVALAIVFSAWFLCKWLIRRRAARKGVTPWACAQARYAHGYSCFAANAAENRIAPRLVVCA